MIGRCLRVMSRCSVLGEEIAKIVPQVSFRDQTIRTARSVSCHGRPSCRGDQKGCLDTALSSLPVGRSMVIGCDVARYRAYTSNHAHSNIREPRVGTKLAIALRKVPNVSRRSDLEGITIRSPFYSIWQIRQSF